jgi:hypothetical protein
MNHDLSFERRRRSVCLCVLLMIRKMGLNIALFKLAPVSLLLGLSTVSVCLYTASAVAIICGFRLVVLLGFSACVVLLSVLL